MDTVGTAVIAGLGVIGGCWTIYEIWQKWLTWRATGDSALLHHAVRARDDFRYVLDHGAITDGQLGFPGSDFTGADLKAIRPHVRGRRLGRDLDQLVRARQVLFEAAWPYKGEEDLDTPEPVPPADQAWLAANADEAASRAERQLSAARTGFLVADQIVQRIERRRRRIHP